MYVVDREKITIRLNHQSYQIEYSLKRWVEGEGHPLAILIVSECVTEWLQAQSKLLKPDGCQTPWEITLFRDTNQTFAPCTVEGYYGRVGGLFSRMLNITGAYGDKIPSQVCPGRFRTVAEYHKKEGKWKSSKNKSSKRNRMPYAKNYCLGRELIFCNVSR